MSKLRAIFLGLISVLFSLPALAQERPNILVIWGDDIGWFNPSAYHRGMMGGSTPNIDRIANEGVLLTSHYGEQSCTAGRSAFITGQHPVRTGLTKVGMPGASRGISPKDPTLAELLKPLGYMTAQFGKNHLGDRDEFLPTNHGFDEFFGNLYHLNAEEEPENPDYPDDPEFRKRFAPRGVIHSYADGRIEDTGPLTRKRMETVDDEFVAATLNFMEKAAKEDKPFFIWFNSTRMHFWTHLKEETEGRTGHGIYADGLSEHDDHVGQILNKLKALGLDENTIVFYSTDNGANFFSWPDAGITPFRGEKNTTWEGGFRVPSLIRWPGKIPAGSVQNQMISHLDMVPTLMAAAGAPKVKQELLDGKKVGNKTFKVHLDGCNQLAYLMGKEDSCRDEFFYFTDDGLLSAVRKGDWKLMFAEQRAKGWDVWREPFVSLRIPKPFNLKRDPFERADETIDYDHWSIDRLFTIYQGQQVVKTFLETFKDFPPRQRPASFSIDQIVEEYMTPEE